MQLWNGVIVFEKEIKMESVCTWEVRIYGTLYREETVLMGKLKERCFQEVLQRKSLLSLKYFKNLVDMRDPREKYSIF